MIDSLNVLMLDNRLFHYGDTFSHTEVMLFSGLRALGVNVVMYPFADLYHTPRAMPQDAWNLQFWCMRGGYNGLTQQSYSHDEIKRLRFDLVVASTRFAQSQIGYDFLIKTLYHTQCPFAMLRTEDRGSAEWTIDDSQIDIKFCADVPIGAEHGVYTMPQCVMYPRSLTSADEKVYGVHCWLSGNTDRRQHVIESLKQMTGSHYVGEPSVDGVVSIIDYLAALRKSQIKYGLRGVGYNSQHLWEGLATEGCLLIGDFEHKTPPPIPEPDVHYVQIDDNNIVEQAEYWLMTGSRREEIAAASRDFVYRYHTPKNRAAYFMDMCAKVIPSIGEKWPI